MRLVSPDHNVVTAPMRNDVELTLEIHFDLQELNSTLTFGYAIYTEEEEPLWWSYYTDGHPSSWPLLQLGRNCLRSSLPKRLLNQGRYRVELIGGLHFQKWFFQPGQSKASFNFEILGGLSDSPLWTSRRDGLLAPVLTWEQQGV
jgi:lipopolysaccharide transport system ATP-binding protein